MTAGPIAAGAEDGTASFELERFEWTSDSTLEIAGRWLGVRGLRFMRPTLELRSAEGRHRLLALLDHKPWAAGEGEEWVAAFPWEGDPVEATEVELAVAPSLAVELPVPGSRRKRSRGARAKARASIPVSHVHTDVPDNRPLVEAQELREERDAAIAARDAVARERDAALTARDEAVRERDRAYRARDDLERDRDAAAAARSAALEEVESALAERDSALARQRSALKENETLRSERDAARAAAEAARRERTAVDEPLPLRADHEGAAPDWRTRLPALGALATVFLLVVLFVYGCG